MVVTKTPLLPDGSPPPQGNAAIVLALFDPMGIRHGAYGREAIAMHLARKTKIAFDQSYIDAIIADLIARNLLVEHKRQTDTSSGLFDEPSEGRESLVTTPLGKKAARLCSLLANIDSEVGGVATEGTELEDLIIEAIGRRGSDSFDSIDAACCCAKTENVSRTLDSLVEQKFIRRISDGFSLLPRGAARYTPLAEKREEAMERDLVSALVAALPAGTTPGSPTIGRTLDTFDVAIICALRSPELEKVLRAGGANWEALPAAADDATSYKTTTYTTKNGKTLRIVAAAAPQMGMPASAVLATKMIMRFRPKLVAMVGIAAGVKTEDQGFGDVLAPDYTLDYGAGRVASNDGKLHFTPDPKPIEISSRLRDRLKEWSTARTHLDEIYNNWPAKKPRTVLALHVGPLGSGAAVLNTRQPIEETRDHWRKLIGVEMEAYGVHIACRDAAIPAPEFLCMKSICDFAVDKNDDWQDYAAYTAAELCHRFLCEEWENLFPESTSSR